MSAEQQYIRVRYRLADYRKAQRHLAATYEAHRAATQALAATGAQLKFTSRPYGAEAIITLPTEGPWRDAQRALSASHRELVQAIVDSPLILSDVARLVGGE
jgi:hypothetical protein